MTPFQLTVQLPTLFAIFHSA